MKYTVRMREVHCADVEVEANSIEEALEKADEKAYTGEVEFEYEYAQDDTYSTVTDESGNVVYDYGMLAE